MADSVLEALGRHEPLVGVNRVVVSVVDESLNPHFFAGL